MYDDAKSNGESPMQQMLRMNITKYLLLTQTLQARNQEMNIKSATAALDVPSASRAQHGDILMTF